MIWDHIRSVPGGHHPNVHSLLTLYLSSLHHYVSGLPESSTLTINPFIPRSLAGVPGMCDECRQAVMGLSPSVSFPGAQISARTIVSVF